MSLINAVKDVDTMTGEAPDTITAVEQISPETMWSMKLSTEKNPVQGWTYNFFCNESWEKTRS